MDESALRGQLAAALSWDAAHVDLPRAFDGIPAELRGARPHGVPYSAWQLLEHIRIAQHDILDFCRNPDYTELRWPEDYWPASPVPPDAEAWDASLQAWADDRAALEEVAADTAHDLTAAIPHGTGQTLMRELLLVVDHTAYHVGEVVLLRRLLGCWPGR